MARPRITYLHLCVGAVLILACALSGFGQPVTITGIGLSGSLTELDSIALRRDTLSVVISFDREVGFDVQGLALNSDQFDLVTLPMYDVDTPRDSALSTSIYDVPRNSVVIDTLSVPNLLHFNLVLRNDIGPRIRSLQMEARLFGTLASFVYLSDPRTSYTQVGDTPPVNNPVDSLHTTYLRYRDGITWPPRIIYPVYRSILNRDFPVIFTLPENAAPGRLKLAFIISDSSEAPHVVYLHDVTADSAQQVRLDAADLTRSSDVDSVTGSPSLTQGGIYRLNLSYQDVDLNPAAVDSVFDLTADIFTTAPAFVEPAHGATAPEPEVRVIYQLSEPADTVQLTFTVDSLSYSPDPRSPHTITLVPSVYGTELQLFYLDGTNIGTGGPYVLFSNNGDRDSLAWGATYNVTLTCGDTLNNPSVNLSHDHYDWPRDIATIPPHLIDPQPNTREDASLWVQFQLPEDATPGSVKMTFRRLIGSDPGSPHVLTFPTLTAAGTFGFFLVATDFSSSDMHPEVTGPGTPEQDNTLVHGVRYLVKIAYQDELGNPVASDSLRGGTLIFDIRTDPPVLSAPQTGDTLSLTGTPVNIQLPEYPRPGTLKMVLTQTGGPEPDPQSPHTLFLDDSLGIFFTTMTLQPGSLINSTHTDSVRNDTTLAARGIYWLTLEYQDTLGNPPASVFVENLYMPSGSSVFVHGRGYGPQQVQPGVSNAVIFQLSLRSLGGISLLRGLRFFNDGGLQPSDVIRTLCHVWSSADTVFDPAYDTIAGTLTDWPSGYVRFSDLGVPVISIETTVFVTLTYATGGDASHRVNLYLDGPQGVDCGGDPVFATSWPIGQPDVPLFVDLLSFTTEQDTMFGALRLHWSVGSEVNNEGFNVLRRADPDTGFSTIASFTNTPSLAGRGTQATGWSYSYVDHGLTPGRTYHYRLEAVTSENFIAMLLGLEASGTPRIPPNDFVLNYAYPNPFNQDVTIEYIVPFSSDVSIVIYDLLGREVRTLVHSLLPPSDYHARWDSRDDTGRLVPSGIYLYRFRADNGRFEKTRKLVLIR